MVLPTASGPVFDLPGGKAMAAVGVDLRTEKYKFTGDARAAAERPDILGAPFDNGNALDGVKREVKAVYGELLLPLMDSLEVTLAARQDDYTPGIMSMCTTAGALSLVFLRLPAGSASTLARSGLSGLV